MKNNNIEISQPPGIIFCTECGDELENISVFNNFNSNPMIVRKKLAHCKEIGRFNGDFCSKFFIFYEDNLEDLFLSDNDNNPI